MRPQLGAADHGGTAPAGTNTHVNHAEEQGRPRPEHSAPATKVCSDTMASTQNQGCSTIDTQHPNAEQSASTATKGTDVPYLEVPCATKVKDSIKGATKVKHHQKISVLKWLGRMTEGIREVAGAIRRRASCADVYCNWTEGPFRRHQANGRPKISQNTISAGTDRKYLEKSQNGYCDAGDQADAFAQVGWKFADPFWISLEQKKKKRTKK